jgi:hypothetical protein
MSAIYPDYSLKNCFSYQSIDKPLNVLNSRRNSKESILSERRFKGNSSRLIGSGLISRSPQPKSSIIIEENEEKDYVPYKNKDLHIHCHSDRKLPHIHSKGCGWVLFSCSNTFFPF